MKIKNLGLSAFLLITASGTAFADDFDITMDVVGVNESFDQAIVNQIDLPFVTATANEGLEPLALEGNALQQLEDLLGNGLTSGNDVSGGGGDAGDLDLGLGDLISGDLPLQQP